MGELHSMPRPLILCGDMHLGRLPHRLAVALPRGGALVDWGPAGAWRRVVDHAISVQAQAVVLAGDVIDQDRDRFEAWAYLHRGAARLLEAGVQVIAVAGNHDHIALPRLVDRLPAVQLLGAGGRWERKRLDGVDLVGWSFPSRHHREDPLTSPGFQEAMQGGRPEVPTLGVLHADLDAGDSPYAPVRSVDLAAQPVQGWFLGHIHQPGDLHVDRPIGYLGSVVGLDRSEVGPRGPWQVEIESGRWGCSQQVLGPVGWVAVDVDLTGLRPGASASDEVVVRIDGALRDGGRSDPWTGQSGVRVVGVSLRLIGEVDAEVPRAYLTEVDEAHRRHEVGGRPWVVVSVDDQTRPHLDLEALAAEPTPRGRLATWLLRWEQEGEAAVPDQVRQAWKATDGRSWVDDEERYPVPSLGEAFARQARSLLTQLSRQRDEGDACT